MRHVDNFFAEKSRVRTTTCTAFFEHYRGKDHGVWPVASRSSNLMGWRGAARGIKCASCFDFSTAVSYDINNSLHGWRCVKGRSREKLNPLRTSGGGGVESKLGMR